MVECKNVIETMAACFIAGGWNPDLANFVQIVIGVVLVTLFPLGSSLILIWFERKISARVQDRIGPNRVGPFGLLQNIADAIKLVLKEDITPAGADRLVYNLAPVIAVLSVVLMWAVVPFTPVHIGSDLDIGVLYFTAIGSVGTLAIMMAGWSSNNKYALLGAFRVVAQLVSYEVPMVLSLLVPVLLVGSMSMMDIVRAQIGMWFIFVMPIAAIIFYISNLAETGRAPFDLIEAESELVAGYNIEYSGMKFGLFMVNEFIHAFTANLLFTIIFLGGWSGPFAEEVPFLGFVWLMLKTGAVYIPSLILRSTVPRVRIDQMMAFNWKFLVPISIVNVIVNAFLIRVIQDLGLAPTGDAATNLIANLPQTLILLGGNVLIFLGVLAWLRSQGRRMRAADQALAARSGDRAIVPAGPAELAHS